MFFAHLTRIVAVLCLVFGLAQVVLGVLIANGTIGPYDVALARYTNASSSGEVIDQGVYTIIFALVLGTLAGGLLAWIKRRP